MSDGGDFAAVALPHLDAVWSLARRLTSTRAEAEDLVQETFLRALAGFGSWRGGDPRAWLVVICLNTARSWARRSRARPREVADVHLADRPARDDPFETASGRLEHAAVGRAMAKLSVEQRTAIELVDIAGLTARAAADLLGCPRGTVLSRVHRGRRRLALLIDRAGARRDP